MLSYEIRKACEPASAIVLHSQIQNLAMLRCPHAKITVH